MLANVNLGHDLKLLATTAACRDRQSRRRHITPRDIMSRRGAILALRYGASAKRKTRDSRGDPGDLRNGTMRLSSGKEFRSPKPPRHKEVLEPAPTEKLFWCMTEKFPGAGQNCGRRRFRVNCGCFVTTFMSSSNSETPPAGVVYNRAVAT